MPAANDLFVVTSGWAYYLDREDPLYPAVFALVRSTVMQQRRLITTNYILRSVFRPEKETALLTIVYVLILLPQLRKRLRPWP